MPLGSGQVGTAFKCIQIGVVPLPSGWAGFGSAVWHVECLAVLAHGPAVACVSLGLGVNWREVKVACLKVEAACMVTPN